ncbi:radical SAM protein [Viscerimonas tarda]
MNVYTLIKKFNKINSPRLKLLALYLMHITNKRYLGIFLDPVLACNLRCKMCYFSDEEKRKTLKGILSDEQLEQIAKAFFSRALKLQIGCGAEPTLYKKMPDIISLAKKQHVPYVSITTNGLLLNEELIVACLDAGLDEITLSMHGVVKETYEYFMTNANYDRFCEMLKQLTAAKEKYNFKLRINYTINEQNLDELVYFFERFGLVKLDILQLRPIQNIGKSEYANFDHSKLAEKYEEVIRKVKEEAIVRNITCMAPSKKQLLAPEDTNNNGVIFGYSYCYIDPAFCWKPDFNLEVDTFNSYSKRKKVAKTLFLALFRNNKNLDKRKAHLNYEVT